MFFLRSTDLFQAHELEAILLAILIDFSVRCARHLMNYQFR